MNKEFKVGLEFSDRANPIQNYRLHKLLDSVSFIITPISLVLKSSIHDKV